MSSVPPPPGGYPPYDPKTQWRMYRTQQKAAWRAQRNSWRAQRMTWKAQYAGAYGPRVPSLVGPLILIAIGVVWLLLYSGRIATPQFWSWYAHWWPALLIAAGVAMLAEWAIDARRETPVRRSHGFVWIIVLLVVFGLGASGWSRMGNVIGPWNWNGDNGDVWGAFGMPEHDFDQPAMSQAIAADSTIDIEIPRGDVTVTASDGNEIEVLAHEVAHAGSDSEAQKIFEAEKASVAVNGSSVVVRSQGNNSNGRVDLTVTIPKSARVIINSGWNDVTATGLGAGIDLTARGDVRLNAITGAVDVHFTRGRHDDIAIHQVDGDVKLEGDCDDLTLSEIKGRVTQNGELEGDVHIENISGGVHLHTSVTDLEVASLPGDLTLDSNDLRVNQATGAVRTTTHAKDVDLNQIYGDTYVENRDGTISIAPAGAYGVEAHNSKGDVEITLPPNASGAVDGSSHNGDIVSDFPLAVSGDSDKKVTGKIGAGATRIVLSAQNGDVRIKKGTMAPPAPTSEAEQPTTVSPNASPNARHLKGKPLQTVTQ